MFRNSKNIKHPICILLLWAFVPVVAYAQQSFRVMFYNVENLFDCEHDSLKNDYEFMPEGSYRWTFNRFEDKLSKIAKVVAASATEKKHGWKYPELVGLCEVENHHCISDLTQRSPLKKAGYRYVMTESPDQRGIDVALLYQRKAFKVLQTEKIRVPHESLKRAPTRDILHVVGKVSTGDTLDVFVCHMPSRSGGQEKSEPYRLFTCSLLKQKVDSTLSMRAKPNAIIMGDFNDYPTDKSIREALGAVAPSNEIMPRALYNLMDGREGGSYRYRGEWGWLDNLIVSGYLLQGSESMHTSYQDARVLNHAFLLEEDDKYKGLTPKRTYRGTKYCGGYSDHLPVCVDFYLRK